MGETHCVVAHDRRLSRLPRMAFGCLCLVVASALVPVAPADAQVAAGPRDEEARGLFLAGRAAFDDARFPEALEHFERSYALSGRLELLYNIGLAAERTGDSEKAMRTFERFVVERPDAPQAADARERLAVLERAAEVRGPRRAAATTALARATAPPSVVPERERPSGGGSLAPWLIGGGGLVVTVTGAALFALGLADAASVTGAPQGSSFADVESQYDRAATFQTLGVVLLTVGLAATATGVMLLVFGDSDEPAARVAIGPGTLRLEGTF